MKEWILSIWSFLILVSVITLFIPNKSVKKILKSIFIVILTVLIIKPFVKYKSIDSFIKDNNIFELNDSFIEKTENKRITELEKSLEEYLSNKSFPDLKIDIAYLIDEDYSINILKVNVNLEKSGIKNDKDNKLVIDKITDEIIYMLNVKKEDVVFRE